MSEEVKQNPVENQEQQQDGAAAGDKKLHLDEVTGEMVSKR